MKCGVETCTVELDEDGSLCCDYCLMDYCEDHAARGAYDLVKCVHCQEGPSDDYDQMLEAMQR